MGEDATEAVAKDDSHQKLGMLLTRGRKALWNASLTGKTAVLLSPLRDFVLDPVFAIATIVLPPIAQAFPMFRPVLIKLVVCNLYILRLLYPVDEEEVDLRRNAANDMLVNSKAGIQLSKFKPPSDFVSTFRGAVAFGVSALADLVSVCMDPSKMKKWFEALTELKAYLDISGVGGELDEAITKPLLRGRLLDNVKILNDIQEEMYADRCEKISTFSKEDIEGPIQEGKRMMRFATAAYGTEMIRSALDRDARPHELENQMKAIAFHCNLTPDDIRIVAVDDGGDMRVLRHFVAVDRAAKQVVLALRGTLSISGALVDMQAMDSDFCGGKAHKGIAEMADNVWEQSGSLILELFEVEEGIEDFSFVIAGHSLGAGAACLLNIKCHKEKLLGNRPVKCYGFAPPPTWNMNEEEATEDLAIQKAIKNTLCYIHDNDCVPLLSVRCVRRLANLMDTVDNRTEHMWAYRRFRIFWEWDAIPDDIVNDVKVAEAIKECPECEGASKLIIPAKLIVWMKKNFAGKYVAYGCEPDAIANMNIFCCQDMGGDHLVEPYEDALDELVG